MSKAIRKWVDENGVRHVTYSPGKQPRWRQWLTFDVVMRSGLYHFQIGHWHLTLWDLMACRPCFPEIKREPVYRDVFGRNEGQSDA